MKIIFSGLHWFITLLLVFITFSLYINVKQLKQDFSYLVDIQRSLILRILVEEEIKVEEDSYRDGVPRSSGDPFSSAPTKLKL